MMTAPNLSRKPEGQWGKIITLRKIALSVLRLGNGSADLISIGNPEAGPSAETARVTPIVNMKG
jgi:hypothetical protein